MKRVASAGLLAGCSAYVVAVPHWAPPVPVESWDAWLSWLRGDPQRAIALLAGFAAWLTAAWLLVVTTLSLVATSTHGVAMVAGRLVEFLTPKAARGLLEALLGAALAVGPAGAALAAAPAPHAVAVGASQLAPVPPPLVAPPDPPPLLDLDRPDTGGRSPVITPAPSAVDKIHRVRAGDTLWGLAAARLPAGSSPSTITRAWQAWYAGNRALIGADPAFLAVGELLVVPGSTP
jgi:hypothetical protein